MKKSLLKKTLGLVAALWLAAAPASAQLKPHRAPGDAVFQGNLYGVVVSSNETPFPGIGLYRLNSDLSRDLLLQNNYMSGSAAVCIRGKLYVTTAMAYGSIVVANTIYMFDAENYVSLGSYGIPTNKANMAVGYAYDSMNDKAYAITYNSNGSSFMLNNFNYEKRSYSPICSVNETFIALTFAPDGTLYAIDKNGVVKTLSLTDGATEEVVNTGLASTYFQSAAYSPKDNAIIWIACPATGSRQIVKIDPVAKTWEKLSDYTDEVMGLYTTDVMGIDGAPARPTDIEVSYADPGTNNATVSMTVPSVTFDGKALSGEIDVEVTVDGNSDSRATGKAQAGSDYSIDVDMQSAGAHRLAVVCKNSIGQSQAIVIPAFGGNDTPSKVSDLQYTLDDNGLLTLTWGASKAINNGYTGTISYIVERNGAEVTTTTDTKFTETLGSGLQLYSYKVTPVANGIKGEAVSTENFTYGDLLDLPYNADFSNEALFKIFTPVDANGDNTTWFLGTMYNKVSYQPGSATPDDYLVTPPFHVEANHTYVIEFDSELDFGPTDPCTLSVVVTDGATKEACQSGDVVLDNEVIDSRDTRRIQATWRSDESGEKRFAIRVYEGPSWFRVNVRNLTIKDLGNITSPAAVEDLTVEPEGNGSLKAKVSFTVPSLTMGGTTLDAVSRMELSRDGAFVRAFSSVKPGEKIEYVDEVDVPDFYSYSVVGVAGDSDKGPEASTRLYVGSYDCPATFMGENAQADFRNLKIIDQNEDNCTWRWDDSERAVKYIHTEGNTGDYLFTPMVEMKAGKVYEISYDARVTEGSAGFVLFTKLSHSMSLNDILTFTPAQVVRSSSEYDHIVKFVQVPADGTYSVVIDAGFMQPGDGVFFKNISVKEGPDSDTPAAVDNIAVVPAAKGELKATLSFDLPTTNIMGDNYSSDELLGAKVYNSNGELCGELALEHRPGEQVSVEVSALQGVNRFTVYATSAAGQGDKDYIGAFCGMDTPFRVPEVFSYPSKDNMSTVLEWDEPYEGTHKGYFNPDELVYHIYIIDEAGNQAEIAKTTNKEYEFKVYDSSLRKYTFGVLPETKAGMGSQMSTHFNQLGTPCKLPFEETFADGTYSTEPWYAVDQFDTTHWDNVTSQGDITSDDNGFLYLHDDYNHMSISDLYLPKISLADYPEAQLELTTWQYYEAKAVADVLVSTDDVEYVKVGSAYSDAADGIGDMKWKTWTFDLTPFSGKWIQIKLNTTIYNDYFFALNDIRISGKKASVDGLAAAGISAFAEGQSVAVTGACGKYVAVYSIDGRQVYAGLLSTDHFNIPVPAGIYIATANGSTIGKIAVK